MVFKLFSSLSVLAVAGVCIVTAARCLGCRGIWAGRRVLRLQKPLGLRGEPFTCRQGAIAVAWGLGALCLTWGVSFLYCGIFQGGAGWAAVGDAWNQWDAKHYLSLAELGYFDYIEDGQHLFLVFFPLYPWLVRLLHMIIPSWAVCGHVLSGLCYVGSCYVLARLATEEFGWPVGRRSLAFMSVYPFAFFFEAAYTESLFLLLSVACFYCIRRHRWPLAGLLGALAALTRMQGVFLAVAAVAEYGVSERPWRQLKERDWRALWRGLWGKLAWMGLIPLGTAAYLWLNYAVAGDPLQFMTYQREHWYQGLCTLGRCLSILGGELAAGWGERNAFAIWGPNLAVFVLCLGLLLYGARRLPPAWMAYCLICVLLNYSLSWPLSCGRYMACAFPLPVLLAVAGERRPAMGQFALASSGVLYGAYLFSFLNGAIL